jgi:hypothetical protein
MKINNYPTYLKKDWKTNKGRFVNNQDIPNQFILPLDDIDYKLLLIFLKVKCIVKKEFEEIHSYKYYNATLK